MAAKKKNAKSKGVKVSAKSTKKAAVAVERKAGFDKVSKVRTKTQVLAALAQNTGIAKRDVAAIFDTLSKLIGNDLAKGPGIFTVPGLMKVTVVRKPATKARKGLNPFTGEEIMFKAKPARNVVRIRPLKGLKDLV